MVWLYQDLSGLAHFQYGLQYAGGGAHRHLSQGHLTRDGVRYTRLPSEDSCFESLSAGMIIVLIGSFDARISLIIWFSWGQLQSR
jgi:hypothetical protein